MTSQWPQVQFVSAPTETATVLFDFNRVEATVAVRVIADGWSVGVPSLEGDVDAIDPLYGPRTISYNLQVEGTKANALLAQSQLARHVIRDAGWLRFQLSPLRKPVWFRTYRMVPGDLSFDRAYNDDNDGPTRRDLWQIEVEIPAEPFAYGGRVVLPSVVVSNDPTGGGAQLSLADIVGDAPAPFRFKVTSPTNPNDRWMQSVHSGAVGRLSTLVDIGTSDGLTALTDTGAGVSNGNYVGGSYRQVSFATQTALAPRLSKLTQPIGAGRFKVLVRATRPDAGAGGHVYRFTQTDTGGTVLVNGEQRVVKPLSNVSGGSTTWVDLGEFSFPAFGPPPGEPTGIADSGGFIVEVGAVGTMQTVRLDALLFVPVEFDDTVECSTLTTALQFGISGEGSWDGELEQFWSYKTVGGSTQPNRVQMQGRFPRLVPGAVNTMTTLMNVDTPIGFDVKAATYTVEVSYHPQFLYIGDG